MRERPCEGLLLGFDPGERRIGIATAAPLLGCANSRGWLPAQGGQPDWDQVATLIAQWAPVAIVVGIPYHADGTDSTSTAAARQLAGRLHGRFGLPVYTVDERLSSREAEARLSERRRRLDPDAVHGEAAAVILETYLSQQGAA